MTGGARTCRLRGRSSRAAYWWWALFQVIALLVAFIIDTAVGTTPLFYILVALGLFLPGLAVLVRRLHDTSRSGWWVLIGLIPIIGGIVLQVFTLLPSEGPNQWGSAPEGPATDGAAFA